MGKSKKIEIEYETPMELDEAVGYLEEIIHGLKSGTLHISRESHSLTLHPRGTFLVEIEAEQGEKKEGIEIELKWFRHAESDGEKLTLSDAEPDEAPDEETPEPDHVDVEQNVEPDSEADEAAS